jgi:hypothetical protein
MEGCALVQNAVVRTVGRMRTSTPVRVNRAVVLLRERSPAEVVRALRGEFALSERVGMSTRGWSGPMVCPCRSAPWCSRSGWRRR